VHDNDEIEGTYYHEPWDETHLPKQANSIDLIHVRQIRRLRGNTIKNKFREFLTQFKDILTQKLKPKFALVIKLVVDENN